MSSSKIGENDPHRDGAIQEPTAAELDRAREAQAQPALTPQEIKGAQPEAARADDEGLDRIAQESANSDYVHRIAQECEKYRQTLERRISSKLNVWNHGLTKDIASEAILRTVRYAREKPSDKVILSVNAFLNTTADHLVIDANTRRPGADRRLTVSSDDVEAHKAELNLSDRWADAKDIVERIDREEKIALALKDAQQEQKELFYLRYRLGKTPKEIASDLGIRIETVRYRLKKLDALLRPYFPSLR